MSNQSSQSSKAYENHDLAPDAAIPKGSPVRFAFEFPELLSAFTAADATANRARDRNRRHGILGVIFVLIALLYASSAPIRPELPHGISMILVYLAAALGMIGTVLGLAGLRRNSQRLLWLTSRLETELLRLFHFSYVAARLPDIEAAARDPNLQAGYVAARKAALDQFIASQLKDPATALNAAISPAPAYPFAHVTPQATSATEISPLAADILTTWRTVRLDWQWQYCEAKLAHHQTGRKLSPLQQEHAFSMLGWGCIAVVVALHLTHFAEAFVHLPTAWLETLIIWAALISLAGRALEDGLKPQREVERYQQYRANIQVARDRFDAATDLPTRLEIMRGFEQASLEEMRVFLRNHAGARFLL